MVQSNELILQAKRIVVKVGSSSVSGSNAAQVDKLIDALAERYEAGVQIILVSSGAIASGLPLLKLQERPADLATQQAAAAVGQNALMVRYQQSLDAHGIVAAQILLTANDMVDETHRSNAQRAMEKLLALRVLPIVNENDTVATQEIRFGDNDRLAALVASLVQADVLVLLSDIDALYTLPPNEAGAERIKFVAADDRLERIKFGGAGSSGVGTGGAATKVAAARIATEAGIPCLLTETSLVREALNGAELGTWFEAVTLDN